MPEVKMVTIGDLFAGNYKFILPAYQRGYRWRTSEKVEDSQVLQLLDDIEDYLRARTAVLSFSTLPIFPDNQIFAHR